MLATFILEGGARPPALRAIVTDSEGIAAEQQEAVERAFGCPVYQTYGLGETGQVAMQCARRRYHVLSRSAVVEILDEAGTPVRPGEAGQIVVTDLTATLTPFIRYRTGDLATPAAEPCACGWHSPSWQEIVGRLDDRVLTPDGRWIGRLSHVTKPGVGIRESQIAQTAIDRLVIRVVPDRDFDPRSMAAVVQAAHTYLGAQMQVTWEEVPSLPRTRAGKLRHVVREFLP
jgi:phenylacetate-CoA ligase